MQREARLNYARQYGRRLAKDHPAIAGIILGGSLARGNDLPISDVDLWCFVDRGAGDLPIEKHAAEGVYMDIEQQPADLLWDEATLRDPYVCGYLYDALILFDRDGDVSRCQERIRAGWQDASYRDAQLSSLRAVIERNYREFGGAIEAGDAAEVCRSSIFAAWTLCDYLLTSHGIPPGGARGLARLRRVDLEASDVLVEFEGAPELDEGMISQLIAVYLSVADPSSFFDAWIQKVHWMFEHDYSDDAFHALWIALGLRIKDARTRLDDAARCELAAASKRWLKTIGWEGPVLAARLQQLRQMTDEYCRP